MDERLLPSNDNDIGSSDVLSASHASLQRSASLLERIRAQREREAMTASSAPSAITAADFSVPNYAPTSITTDAMGSDAHHAAQPQARSIMGASSLNFSGLIRGFGRNTTGASAATSESTRGLLGASPDNTNQYSMSEYFRMFVMDVYTYFRSLPIPVQAGVIVFMLWIIYRLI